MVTQNAINVATGASSTVLAGAGSGTAPTFTGTPTVTSITFGAGTALSNYAEGVFTPTLDGAVSGTTTYSVQKGYYTRIGNVVTLIATITITGATGTGDATLAGFPFTVKNQSGGNGIGPSNVNAAGWAWPVGGTKLNLNATINTTTSLIAASGSGIASANLQMSNAAATIAYEITYQI